MVKGWNTTIESRYFPFMYIKIQYLCKYNHITRRGGGGGAGGALALTV